MTTDETKLRAAVIGVAGAVIGGRVVDTNPAILEALQVRFIERGISRPVMAADLAAVRQEIANQRTDEANATKETEGNDERDERE
jgi:hypothetical protein